MRFRTPSPSMIVALIALAVSLTGSAIAAQGLISGSKLKNNSVSGNKLENDSVSGNKLENNSVTGKQILESSLAQVPSAALAQRAQSAALATAADTAQRAQSAARADRATAAGTAQLAESASKLGTLTPSDVVQGGGQSFARSTALSENTGVGPAFDIPTVGNLNLGCDTQGNLLVGELTNTTGQSVLAQETIDGVNSGGSTFGPGANIVNLATSPSQGGSIQVLAVWPSVNPTHSADFTIGWYLDGVSHECTALVEGVVR